MSAPQVGRATARSRSAPSEKLISTLKTHLIELHVVGGQFMDQLMHFGTFFLLKIDSSIGVVQWL